LQNILVTGGAGYIGSMLVQQLLSSKFQIHVLDNLSTGHASSLPKTVNLHTGDLRNLSFVKDVFSKVNPTAVIHLAAKASVPESTQDPIGYFQNNVGGSLNLLQCIEEHDVRSLIFSSTAAVYSGKNSTQPILTTESPDPQNPYGHSKLMTETSIEWLCKKMPLNAVALRYFNVAGASLDGSNGQRTKGSAHLIKKISEYIVGKEKQLSVFGADYPTTDGTCVRDYIHVLDIVDIHLRCLEAIQTGGKDWKGFHRFNCGYGVGHSVLDVIHATEKVIDTKLNYKIADRRAGDPAFLVADPTELNRHLDWKPKHQNLVEICRTAISFEKNLAKGNHL
jgi:UDP-glucose 4-epimerase